MSDEKSELSHWFRWQRALESTNTTSSCLENGYVNPTLKTVEKLADALEIKVCDFFPSEKRGFWITPPKLGRNLKKIARLWEGLRPAHRRMMLQFVRACDGWTKRGLESRHSCVAYF